MKLLFCNNCLAVFSLSHSIKKCDCGETSGQYVGNLLAEFSGPATMIGFLNSDFKIALNSKGMDFKAFTIEEPCQSFKRI